MENKLSVAIIILVYNGARWIEKCLDSVLATDYSNYEIILVDNLSQDDSVKIVNNKYPQVKLIKNKKNYGFAEGNNIAMRYALEANHDYIVLLNQDTTVQKNWLSDLVNAMEKNSRIGVLSPMQYDYDGINLDRNFYNNVLKLYTSYEVDKENNSLKSLYKVNEVIGASMMLRSALLRKIGLFDPLYFLYAEEYDLCRKARYHNYTVGVITTSKIYHWHSLIQTNGLSKRSRFILFKSRFLYALKNPERPFIKNFYNYYFKMGALSLAGGIKTMKNMKYLIRFIQVQLWILCKLPIIALHQYRDRNLKKIEG
jgi:GT2 family glycosyltransferase